MANEVATTSTEHHLPESEQTGQAARKEWRKPKVIGITDSRDAEAAGTNIGDGLSNLS